MGPAVYILSDDEEIPVAAKPPGGGALDDDDDDCVMLDGDPLKAAVVVKEKTPGKDGSEDEELQIVAEKGEVACRDFPHPRYLCASFPFSTTSHAKHCTMCHCYVCDSLAPCPSWDEGTLFTDHCHATHNDGHWKIMRQLESCRQRLQKSFPSSSTAVANVSVC